MIRVRYVPEDYQYEVGDAGIDTKYDLTTTSTLQYRQRRNVTSTTDYENFTPAVTRSTIDDIANKYLAKVERKSA